MPVQVKLDRPTEVVVHDRGVHIAVDAGGHLIVSRTGNPSKSDCIAIHAPGHWRRAEIIERSE